MYPLVLFDFPSEETYMTESEMRPIVAANIASCRKKAGMTQAELAEKLNYSDKTVSKWERGEGLPDLIAAQNLAGIFHITIDALVKDAEPVPVTGDPEAERALREAKRRMILLLSTGLCVLTATLAFFAARVFLPAWNRAWLCFLYAVPAAMIVCVVFSSIWWSRRIRLAAISGLIWSAAACVHLTVPTENLWLIYVVGAVVQLLFIAWFYLLHIKNEPVSDKES